MITVKLNGCDHINLTMRPYCRAALILGFDSFSSFCNLYNDLLLSISLNLIQNQFI
jgi:hypothetical protein